MTLLAAQLSIGTGTYVILLLVPLAAGVLGYGVYHYNRPAGAFDSADRLVLQLCRLHRIGHRHRQLLLAIAKSAELPNPAILFADPEVFETATQIASEKLPWTDQDQRAVGQLRRQMFS